MCDIMKRSLAIQEKYYLGIYKVYPSRAWHRMSTRCLRVEGLCVLRTVSGKALPSAEQGALAGNLTLCPLLGV